MTQGSKSKYHGFTTFTIFIVIILIMFLIVRLLFIDVRSVNGTSMLPSFYDGQKVYVLKNTLGNSYHRDDVVMFTSPENAEEFFIKRIIGVPGDEITITMDHIFVNGHLLDDVNRLSVHGSDDMTIQTWSLEDGEFFVMGDNRLPGGSYDSREYGPIKASNIYGRVIK